MNPHPCRMPQQAYPVVEIGMNRRKKTTETFKKRLGASDTELLATTGFTLLEVIVALTILGLMLIIIFGAFRLGLSAWARGETTKEDYQKLRTVSQLVSSQIRSIVPYKIKTEKAEGDYLAFEGKTRSVKFVSALPIRAKQAEGFVYATYEFEEESREGGRLILYEQRVLNKNFFEEQPKEELGVSLIEGISDLRFEYYRKGDPANNKTEGWVEEWNAKEEKELPSALRMTVTYKNKGEKGEKEEVPLTVLASIQANQYEDLKRFIGPTGLGRRTLVNTLRRQGY
jgi:general secretion pathway protein J